MKCEYGPRGLYYETFSTSVIPYRSMPAVFVTVSHLQSGLIFASNEWLSFKGKPSTNRTNVTNNNKYSSLLRNGMLHDVLQYRLCICPLGFTQELFGGWHVVICLGV